MGYRLSPDVDDPKQASRPSAAQRSVAVLPTLFTLGNLLCGFLAIFFASRPADTPLPFQWTPLTVSALLVFLGMFLDAVDGRLARVIGASSELGEQLDSMADMVTFGVAPAFIAVMLLKIGTPFVSDTLDATINRLALLIASIYVACAALRLARFNVETDEDDKPGPHLHFRGMPSPGAAGTIASLILLHQHFLANHLKDLPPGATLGHLPLEVRSAAIALLAIMLLVAFAMVSALPYLHFSNRFIARRARAAQLARLVPFLVLAVIWFQFTLAAAFILYALSAPAIALYRLLRPRKPQTSQSQ